MQRCFQQLGIVLGILLQLRVCHALRLARIQNPAVRSRHVVGGLQATQQVFQKIHLATARGLVADKCRLQGGRQWVLRPCQALLCSIVR